MKRVFLCVMTGGALGFLGARMIPVEKEKVLMKRDSQGYALIETVQDVCAVYPTTTKEIADRAQAAQQESQRLIDQVIACPADEQTQETVLRTFDRAFAYAGVECSYLELIKMVHPDAAIRQAADTSYLQLKNFWTEHAESNVALYQAFKTYAQGNAKTENLSDEDQYLLKMILEDFERAGLNLLPEERAKVIALKKQCSELEETFSKNLDSDIRTLNVPKEALAGLDEEFIAALPKEGDLYALAMDYPTQAMISSYCTVASTRKAYWQAFKNRAYPINVPVLEEVVALRDQLAKALGFESFAHYSLSDQMMQTPERAWEFENSMLDRSVAKAKVEYARLISDLPEGVLLRADGLIEPWDFGFVMTYFKKKHYEIDERVFAEYFPMEKTIAGLISIYEQFFNLSITSVPVTGMWHQDVQLLQIANKEDGKVRGYVFLDMFPRPNKYGHAAQFDGVRALKKADGTYYPSVVTVVCNFTKPLGDKPSLLKYGEVNTFFHEFGHAIHSTLGATKYACTAGTATETDFVELPSQMLENWIEDAQILKMISSHYITGKQLPDQLIQKRIELLKYGNGLFVTRQLSLGMISLSFFGSGADKDLPALYKKYTELCCPYIPYYDDAEHGYCSFGHLMGYNARYYGYLSSLVMGCDVFEVIKEQGLLNPQAGKKYVDAIIGNGGSKSGNDMLRDFLGREPRNDAFYKKMDL